MSREKYISEVAYSFIQLRKRFAQEAFDCQQGKLSHAQSEALLCIFKSGQLPTKQLAHNLAVTPGAATQLIDALESAALVERQADQYDRRVTQVSVSERGKMLLKESKAARMAHLKQLLKPLTDIEIELLAQLLQKISKQIEEGELGEGKNK